MRKKHARRHLIPVDLRVMLAYDPPPAGPRYFLQSALLA
jgi:hypothetical protein